METPMKTKVRYVSSVAAAGLALLLGSTAIAAESDWTPDAWITTKAKLALMRDADVSARDVNVDTVDGRVTLHGKVPSVAARDAAGAAVQEISGVRTVVNILQVVAPSAKDFVEVGDAEIQNSVEKALAANSSLADSDIKVQSVNDGVVLLSGEADDFANQLEAVRVAAAVSGVRRVSTEFRGPDKVAEIDGETATGRTSPARAKKAGDVGEALKDGAGTAASAVKDAAESTGHGIAGIGATVSNATSDAWITTKVKSRMLASSAAPALDVNVDTSEGIVTLFGTVGSAEEKAAAEGEATQTDGVKSVRNLLQVVPEAKQAVASRKDDEIERGVEKELGDRKQFSDADIDVEAQNGVVRLTGTAPTSNVRLSAATVARSVGGVRSVTNDIEVAQRQAMRD
jgi:hyperosmotically inducible periplasmic protein